MKGTIVATVLLLLCAWGLLYSCGKDTGSNDTAGGPTAGAGGSLARFTIRGDYLYAVDDQSLQAYNLQDGARPQKVSSTPLAWGVETIYAFNNYLFLGTQTGLLIYSLDTLSKPRYLGEARHARSCDPVVANDSVAFVTLKGSARCGPAESGLYVHDIKNIDRPVLKKTLPLPDPVGLGLQDTVLYVCCGTEGLKLFNVKAPFAPVLIGSKTDGNYMDVIPYHGLLICFVQDGILLYDISNPAAPQPLKKIAG
ncbi:hypothetical protein V9K67_16310 [Paraflavisolibacter sp. H34]|uniref:LVIVD repeat-containing protein n=1 Tax=Huijunlia imazamoxiresistens TaxID=3127457 RepID=UPI0030178756